MLKQMPDTSLPIVAAGPQKSEWYVNLAYRIHRMSPRLYNLVRFLRRAALHVVSRPILALPLAALGAPVLVVAFNAELAAYRPWVFTGLGLGVLAIFLAYIAFRSQGHAESLHQEVGAIRVEAKGLSGRLPHSFKKIHDKLLTIDARTASIERDAPGTTRALDDIRAVNRVAQSKIVTLEANNKELKTRIARLERLLGPNGQVETIRKDVAGKVDSLNREVSDKFTIAENSVKSVEGKVNSLSKEVSDKFTTAENSVKSVEGKLAVIDKWAQFDNATWYQHFNRRLTNDQIATLESEWRKRLSVPISRAVLGYMANRACEIERQLDGRLATSVEDILLRSLVARAVKGPKIDVLEIGTLFGVGAGVMYDALANHYEDIHFTLLDPLEGYYNSSQADILTGQRIDERTLRRNLARVGIAEDQFTLIKKLSTDAEAIKATSERQYDLLVIDADHSYAGVKADFENYARRVKLGGYIIFDDYGSADWPDVQEYVDSEISSVDFVARVGASWRTCVYRVVKNPAA